MSSTRLILSLALVCCAVGCGNYDKVKAGPLLDTSRTSASELSFAGLRKLVLDRNCLSCHPGYASYGTVQLELNKIIGNVMSDRMPKNAAPLSDELKSYLLAYQRAGAPLGEIAENGPVPVPQASWSYVAETVIFPKCVVCHNPNGQASYVDLSNRQAIFENRSFLVDFDNPSASYLLQISQDESEPMPPVSSGIDRLTSAEVELLREWIRLGLP